MTRRERLERKLERREEWAAKAAVRRDSAWKQAHDLGDMIPLGQPILVGHHSEGKHRRHIDKINRAGQRGLEEHRKAEHHADKADGLATQLERSVFSDDDDAIEQLEARIAEREAARDHGKRINAAWRKAGKPDPLDPEAWDAFAAKVGKEDAAFAERGLRFQRRADAPGLFTWAKPYDPKYDGANLRRDRERIEEIQRRQKATERAEAAGGVTIERRGEDGGWCRVTFAEKPEREILNALRAAGYSWGGGCWSGRTEYLPDEVAELEVQS